MIFTEIALTTSLFPRNPEKEPSKELKKYSIVGLSLEGCSFYCLSDMCSMPYASKHYPFEGKEKFETEFPAQFIAEGLDQTRGWFYTLLILGVHLFGKAPFENVVVNGIVLAEDGKKMSKRLKNYPEPDLILKKYGADAVRLYMINSPVVRAETLKFKEDGVREIVSSVLIPWKNSFIFFEQQTALYKKFGHGSFVFNPDHPQSSNSLDRWIMASAQSLIVYVKQEMNGEHPIQWQFLLKNTDYMQSSRNCYISSMTFQMSIFA